ncbi:MAG TPA: hypothetical protein VGV40_06080 [Solirubrobacteraceae bacterium]|nr:hypothetical protein [Solirubrobacteraceae bacterium]
MQRTQELEREEGEDGKPLERRAFLGWAAAGAIGLGLVFAGCEEDDDDDDDDDGRSRRRRRRR